MAVSTEAATRPGPPDRDDPLRRAIDIVQRGRILLDLAIAELAASEQRLGPFHEETWTRRRIQNEARNAWDRLRATFGRPTVEAALNAPPATVLTLDDPSRPGELPRSVYLVISGKTFRACKLAPSSPAPTIWRLDHIPPEDPSRLETDPFALDPYHAVRLLDGSTRCDCGEWTFQVDGIAEHSTGLCKHLAALRSLGWI